ncbi:hypothetical protein BDF14DRAFT_1771216 [Spinellus fusiger]|nr:hypothetical protein BDF14DRAFT_1771216 [Spinellus fusiger]
MRMEQDSVGALQAQINLWKQKEQAWEKERTTLVSFQTKLAMAGSHIKTLAQENATLTQHVSRYKEEQKNYDTLKKQSLWEEQRVLLEKERDEKESSLETERRAVSVLAQCLQEMNYEKDVQLPDLSTPDLLAVFIEEKRQCQNKREEQGRIKEKALEERVNKLTAELSKVVENIVPTASTASTANACTIEAIHTTLSSIISGTHQTPMDTSLPPTLLQILEALKEHMEEQSKTIANEKEQTKATVEASQRDFNRKMTELQLTINTLSEEKEKLQVVTDNGLEEKCHKLQQDLEKTEKTKQEAESHLASLRKEHQSLLGKLSHIKETLMPRLEADKNLRQTLETLTMKLNSTQQELETEQQKLEQSRKDMLMRDRKMAEEVTEKERTIAQLQVLVEESQVKREELQVVSMQIETERSQLERQLQHTELELAHVKRKLMENDEEKESERASLSNLQTVLEEFQATKDAEISATVEHIERQLENTKASLIEYQSRTQVAEASLEQYQKDVAKAQRYEQEIKEMGLLIGKLRHEAIILNEHLVEAMRRLKEESSENNVDRQLVTSLLVGFLLAPRGDRKRYDILTILASVLQLTTDQKEQVGLIRSAQGTLPRSSSTSSIQWQTQRQSLDEGPKESFTDAWISFLLKESNTQSPSRQDVSDPTRDI